MADDPLSAERVLQHLADALPTHAPDDTTSDLSSSYEAIALFAHGCMVAVDFRLIGFQQDKSREQEFAELRPRLHAAWNATFNTHSFLYTHPQSSMQYLLKIDRLGGKAEIRGIGLAEGAEKITRVEVTAKDYVSSSALPLRITMRDDGTGKVEDRSDLSTRLQDIFISRNRVQDLIAELKLNILQPLIPGLHKEGYQETGNTTRADSASNTSSQPVAQPRQPRAEYDPPQPFRPPGLPHPNPLAAPPAGDFQPPGFDDEHRILHPSSRFGPGPPVFPDGRSPFNIGHDDLRPPGLGGAPGILMDPLRGGGGRSGMYPTFDDPLFDARRGGGVGGGGIGGGGIGGFGGSPDQMGYDPHAPPGARYDDPGPGGLPGGGLPGGGGGPLGRRGGGGGSQNPFSGFGGNDFL